VDVRIPKYSSNGKEIVAAVAANGAGIISDFSAFAAHEDRLSCYWGEDLQILLNYQLEVMDRK